jgi:hypothetical protein
MYFTSESRKMNSRSEYQANMDLAQSYFRPQPVPRARELSWLSRLIVRFCGF